jgi:hypothetical protein
MSPSFKVPTEKHGMMANMANLSYTALCYAFLLSQAHQQR